MSKESKLTQAAQLIREYCDEHNMDRVEVVVDRQHLNAVLIDHEFRKCRTKTAVLLAELDSAKFDIIENLSGKDRLKIWSKCHEPPAVPA